MEFQITTGQQFQQHINSIAGLRISIFKEYPYLYDGDIQTEMEYLKSYTKSKHSVLIIVKDKQNIIGAVTGIPLAEADEIFLTPFAKNQSIQSIFYLGEILLLKEYRGKGIGYQMYRMFEDLVRQKTEYHKIALAEVIRCQHDPRKPKNYTSLQKFWVRLGYVEHSDMVIQANYKEIDSNWKIPHSLVYSFKDLYTH